MKKMSLQSIFFRGGRNWNWNWNHSYRMMSSSSSSSSTTDMKSSSPWLMLPSHPDTTKLYSLAEKKVVSIKKEAWAQGRSVKHMGCTQGWMASFNEDNQQAFLSNPLTGRHIKLPHNHTTDNWPSNIILTSSPDSHDCRAIITYSCIDPIAMCFPAHKSPTWLPLCDYTAGYQPKQIAYSTRHKRLFCLTTCGQFECWDLESPSLVWKAHWYSLFDKDDEDEDDPRLICEQYLAMDDRSGRLFLVFRNMWGHVRSDGSSVGPVSVYGTSCYHDSPCKTIGFDVYEIDGYKGKATYMEGSLDGLAMFVGANHSFAMPAAHDLDLTPDSIYFVEDYDEEHAMYESSEGGHDIGIFNYVDTKFSSMYYPSHVSQISRRIAPAFWFTQMDVV